VIDTPTPPFIASAHLTKPTLGVVFLVSSMLEYFILSHHKRFMNLNIFYSSVLSNFKFERRKIRI
jgi:hypothetical protein